MRWLALAGAVSLLFSCAGVGEIEVHSKENVSSIEGLFRPSEIRSRIEVDVRKEGFRPLLKESGWIRVWRGSYSENGTVEPPGWIFLRLEEERPVTSF